jgi:four helix bundle suffix protein
MDEIDEIFRPFRPPYPEIAANAALVLIGVACALLDRQISALATTFTAVGVTERLHRVRSEHRKFSSQ